MPPSTSPPRSTGSAWDSILGTIAGDDTILLITRDPLGGDAIAERFLQMSQGSRRTDALTQPPRRTCLSSCPHLVWLPRQKFAGSPAQRGNDTVTEHDADLTAASTRDGCGAAGSPADRPRPCSR